MGAVFFVRMQDLGGLWRITSKMVCEKRAWNVRGNNLWDPTASDSNLGLVDPFGSLKTHCSHLSLAVTHILSSGERIVSAVGIAGSK